MDCQRYNGLVTHQTYYLLNSRDKRAELGPFFIIASVEQGNE